MRPAASGAARPVVAVIGTTGSGKSQLAVSLAQSLLVGAAAADTHAGLSRPRGGPARGVVLSADSMQLYKGLDIITNKVTAAEMGGVEHWGLDIVQPGEGGSWELGTWCYEADKKMATLDEHALPIICGGTHYFIQHFLFPPPELSTDRSRAQDPHELRWTPPCPCPAVDVDGVTARLLETFWTTAPAWPAAAASSETPGVGSRIRPTAETDVQLLALWKVLEAVDPNEAGRWHWRDGRKVRRGLERWWERRGQPLRMQEGESGDDGGPTARFRTLIFWVYEPMETLRPRLDARVDRMVENGLLDEVAELRRVAARVYGAHAAHDHTDGIFQSIGYKEFAALNLSQAEPRADPVFAAMLDRTKLSTHQYAKSQVRWIRKNLLPAVRDARRRGGQVWVYVVKGGQEGEDVGRDMLKAFLAGDDMPDPKAVGHPDAPELLAMLDEADARVPDTAKRQVLNSHRVCAACSSPSSPVSIIASEWSKHLSSKVHKRNVRPVMSKEERIAANKAQGEARRLERERERLEKQAMVVKEDM
ncbi:tRNA dimethylallyltransferase, mitochondrial [Cryptotrichosporon argae]